MPESFRLERDALGDMPVPAEALYGPHTARAAANFPISGWTLPASFLRAMALLKKHAALANAGLGRLEPEVAGAIAAAAAEVAGGQHEAQFVVDVFQTGSGTSTHMNMNEVLARLAAQRLGRAVHPNDQVNLGQSSNDVFPSALHVAAWDRIVRGLIPALRRLEAGLQQKASAFAEILKIGRTHLQDATPMFLGQEFAGYAAQISQAAARLQQLEPWLCELPLGGTAVGNGLNTHPAFAARTIAGVSGELGLAFREAAEHFSAQGARDAVVAAGAAVKGAGLALHKVANDIRFLGSGPRLGYGELRIPPLQPGSSIMPGKVNPVASEAVLQVVAHLVGIEAALTFASTHSHFELNTMMPLMAWSLLTGIDLLARSSDLFTERCVAGLEADRPHCEEGVERSLALVTPLAARIGYDRAAEIAREAQRTGKTIREVAGELSGLPPDELGELLDPRRQASPHAPPAERRPA